MNCPECNAAILPNDHFCEECGVSLVATNLTTQSRGCQKCGSWEIDTEGYCTNCGLLTFGPFGRLPFGDLRLRLQKNRNQTATDRLEKVKAPYLAGVSDRGLRHYENEDFFDLAEINSSTAIIVVCDGVSSSQTPEQAARTAAETICQLSKRAIEQGDSPEIAIKAAVASALVSVCNLPYKKSEAADPPSTTLVAAIVQNGIATIASLGDSRAYWISPQGSRQLTKDDSWLTDIIESGQMSEAEAQKSPLAHALTRWLGADAKDNAEPNIVVFPLESPGYLLLCTDGLWNYAANAQELATLVYKSPNSDARTISNSLVEFALSQGGHDNITCAIWTS